jgi:hypothetical protein
VLTGLALVACGSGAKPASGPPATIAGVGVTATGRAPRPSTPVSCARRWNGSANAAGRASAVRRAPGANAALVRPAATSGYFSDHAGRCLVYLVTASTKAVVFVETKRGTFSFTADASGSLSANADVRPGERLRLR